MHTLMKETWIEREVRVEQYTLGCGGRGEIEEENAIDCREYLYRREGNWKKKERGRWLSNRAHTIPARTSTHRADA